MTRYGGGVVHSWGNACTLFSVCAPGLHRAVMIMMGRVLLVVMQAKRKRCVLCVDIRMCRCMRAFIVHIYVVVTHRMTTMMRCETWCCLSL